MSAWACFTPRPPTRLLSAMLNGEPLFEWNYLAALVLVCIGIFLVNRAPQTQETKA